MLRDRKQGERGEVGEWYFMKCYKVTVKKIIMSFSFLCTIAKRLGFHKYRALMDITCINGQSIFAIILYLRSFLYKVLIEKSNSDSIFIVFYLNLAIWFSC